MCGLKKSSTIRKCSQTYVHDGRSVFGFRLRFQLTSSVTLTGHLSCHYFNFICTEDDLSGSGLDFAAEPEVDMKGIKITIDKRAESLIVSQQFSFQFLIGQALIGSLSNGEDDGGSEIAIQSNFISSIWTFPICEL